MKINNRGVERLSGSPRPHNVGSALRRRVRRGVLGVATVVAIALAGLLDIAGSAAAADGVPPDLSMYCALTKPVDTSGTFTYSKRDAGYRVQGGRASCLWWQVSGGGTDARGEQQVGVFPSFMLPTSTLIDWGTACRTMYGHQAYAEREVRVPEAPGHGTGPVNCRRVDWNAYEDASARASAAR